VSDTPTIESLEERLKYLACVSKRGGAWVAGGIFKETLAAIRERDEEIARLRTVMIASAIRLETQYASKLAVAKILRQFTVSNGKGTERVR